MSRSSDDRDRREERREPERCARARARAQGTVTGIRDRAAPHSTFEESMHPGRGRDRREGSTREGPPNKHEGESRGERKGEQRTGRRRERRRTRHREQKKGGGGEEGEGINTTRPTSPQPDERDGRGS